MSKKPKPLGRPLIENPATAWIPGARMTPERLSQYRVTAAIEGMSFSAWIRDQLDAGIPKNITEPRVCFRRGEGKIVNHQCK